MKETKFKDTEIGRIPEDWETLYIHQITEISTGATPSTNIKEYWENGTIRWMSSGELNNKIIYDVNGRITQKGYDNTGTHILPKNCVLIGLAGQGKTRGTAAYNKVELCTNQSIAAILPNSKYESKYLYFYIDSLYDKLRLLSAGDGGRGGLNKQILQNLEIAMPPLSEQHSIASALTSIDNLISSLGKLIEKKKNIKQGAMQQLLTGKVRLQGFSEPWNKCCLSKICNDIFSGKNTTHSNSGMFSVYGSTGIIGYTDTYKYNYPTILVARVGANAGTVNKAVDCYDVSDNTLIISLKPNQNIDLLTYILKYKKLNSMIFGSGQPLITGSQLKSLTIEIPVTIAEQQAIATILTKMDDEITALEAKKAKYEAIKQGMMQQLLTGKIRLIS